MKQICLFISIFSFRTFSAQNNCGDPTGIGVLDVNDVSLVIGPSGNVGYHAQTQGAGFEAPIGSETYAIYSMSTRIGGTTPGQQLKLAGQTYRQNGNDFWPGPVSNDGTLFVDADVCAEYDKVWSVYRSDVDLHKEYYDRLAFDAANGTTTASDPPFDLGYTIPTDILDWPAHGDITVGQDHNLAPFIDLDGDNFYEPAEGEYPAFYYPELGIVDKNFHLFGDQVLWWIYNDVGNVHQEFAGDHLGVEFQCTAYAFNDPDELKNTVFFRQKIINRGTETLQDARLGLWVDGDLGCSTDDYIGCDVGKSLGYMYNGDANDEDCFGLNGYGTLPPAVGTDILEGPLANANDGVDNDLDQEIDELDEHWAMWYFNYYSNNSNPVNGNASSALDAFNLMRGFWLNGQQMTYGGDATDSVATPARYVYPGDSDPFHYGTNGVDLGSDWTEGNEANAPGDRRYLQSTGPFVFEPGGVYYMHSSLIWAKSDNPDDPYSLGALCDADLLVQNHFDSCFVNTVIINGVSDLNGSEGKCFQIYPNPSNGIFTLAFSESNVRGYSLEIFDARGAKLLDTELDQVRTSFDLGLDPGSYVLKVSNQKGIICIQKMTIVN